MKYLKPKISITEQINSLIRDLKYSGISNIYFDKNKFILYTEDEYSKNLINEYISSYEIYRDIQIK